MDCRTCKNSCDCKSREAFEALNKLSGDNAECSGYEYEKPKTLEEIKKEFIARFL